MNDAASPSATDLLDQANACHDDDVPRGAALLRAIDAAALPVARQPLYAFLLNHVLGEKLGAWAEALGLHQRLLALPAPAAVLWRQAGAAALALGDPTQSERAAAAYAAANDTDAARAREVLQLSAATYQVPGRDAETAARVAHAAIEPFDTEAWSAASPLDGTVAAALNNLASGLQERPLPDLRAPALRDALRRSADLAHRFWLRAGTWVNAERALYLRAMVGNALGDARTARAHALEALALLDAHDTAHAESVDRAFIELERAHACHGLGLPEEATAAAASADRLAAAFGDAGLTRWYDSRRARLALLPA